MKQKLLLLLCLIGILYSCSEVVGIQNSTIDLPEEPDLSSGITPCIDGFAGPHPCDGYDLMTLIRRDTLLGPLYTHEYGYVWGWTDPQTQKEYAMVGSTRGVFFLDVTDPVFPVHVGQMLSFNLSHHRQIIRTYGNYAYIVSESNDYGMRVFDLTRLRNVSANEMPVEFTEDTQYSAFGGATRITIDEDNGYAYALGTLTFDGGPHFIDITNPAVPLPKGGYDDDGRMHSAQVVDYKGPDSDYQGREILIGCTEGEMVILDVTNKNNPVKISSIIYADTGYPIQGQFTNDMRYYIVGDFWDELSSGLNTRTIVLDFEDLDDPKVHTYYTGPTRANDFGGQISRGTYFLANLTAGVRMIDLSTIDDFYLTESGYFDTFPEHDAPIGYLGATNVYPYFSSGNILINDLYGIFIIRRSE
jgi:choice-of-anchor B domain-containing protein